MSVQSRAAVSCLLLFLVFAAPCLSLETASDNKDVNQTPSVFFPSPNYQFDEVVEGTEVTHAFVIMNKGKKTLNVQKVKAG